MLREEWGILCGVYVEMGLCAHVGGVWICGWGPCACDGLLLNFECGGLGVVGE